MGFRTLTNSRITAACGFAKNGIFHAAERRLGAGQIQKRSTNKTRQSESCNPRGAAR